MLQTHFIKCIHGAVAVRSLRLLRRQCIQCGKVAGARMVKPAGIAVIDQEQATRLQNIALFARSDTIYAGTNEIQLNIISERGLNMPREPRGR